MDRLKLSGINGHDTNAFCGCEHFKNDAVNRGLAAAHAWRKQEGNHMESSGRKADEWEETQRVPEAAGLLPSTRSEQHRAHARVPNSPPLLGPPELSR